MTQREAKAKPVPFPDLLPEIRRFYRAMAKRKGLEFAIEIEADVPPAIVTDRMRLQGLLHSLLANAFEFTREGGVTLRIRRASGGKSEGTVIAFDIVDTGIARSCDGAQPIARVAAMLGGCLVRARRPGEGSTFSLYLPLIGRPT